MQAPEPITLPHLTNEMVVNARKTRLCSFSVALEGWRRGLQLKWYTADSKYYDDMIVFGVNPPGRLFSLSSDKRTEFFFRTRGNKVSNEAVELSDDKYTTKQMLAEAGVPVPLGKGFPAEATNEEIIEYAKSLGFPLVVKPTDGSLGWGVVTNIRDEQELAESLEYVREELEYDEVIVEQYIVGPEYRLYVVDDEVVAAYNRIPANITGNGKNTIEELIHLKNLQRRKNARLNDCLIEIDVEIMQFVEEAGYTLKSVLPKGKKLYLREKSNVSIGGDPIDVTDELSEEIKSIAIRALQTMPKFKHGGVDIIINEGNVTEEAAVVLELNATAQIGGILFPLEGQSRDIPKAIIDYYFPETIGVKKAESRLYFDMSEVLQPLENRSSQEVEVIPAPQGKIYSKAFHVIGTVMRENYHRWLREQALKLGLHGHVERVYHNEIEIMVASPDLDAIKKFKEMIAQSRSAQVKRIIEQDWTGPIKIGFEINERYDINRFRSSQTALRILNRDFTRLDRKKNRVEKDNNHIINSTSWKVTRPLRRISALLKGKS
ncbi:MAG TPA: acylphosphatase [Bacillota bacterium]|nr:acylphosphatase [Bacillota bacterium]